MEPTNRIARLNGHASDPPDPPYDLDAERAVLGGLFLQPFRLTEIPDLQPEHFYWPAHRLVYICICQMGADGKPVDAMTVADELEERGWLEEVGGKCLFDSLDTVPHAAHTSTYAKKVTKYYQRRRLAAMAKEVYRQAHDPTVELEDIVAAADVTDILNVGGTTLQPVGIGSLITAHPALHKPIVHGLLRAGETLNIIAPSKIGKSWLAYSLALSVVTGRDWLDTFPCEVGRVLLLDNELHPATIAHRIPTVAAAMGLRQADYEAGLDVVSLRVRLTDIYALGRLIERITPGTYSLIIADALYRMLPKGVSENDNADIQAIYNVIDRYTGRLNCGWNNVHHASKGNQSDKSTTDVGAGAGAQSRAADCHLILRPHEDPGCFVLDAAVRSFAPIEPLGLRWEFPLWLPDTAIDPARLKRTPTPREQRQQRDDEEGMDELRDILRTWSGGLATPNLITRKATFGRERVVRLLNMLVQRGEAVAEPLKYHGNGTCSYRFI